VGPLQCYQQVGARKDEDRLCVYVLQVFTVEKNKSLKTYFSREIIKLVRNL
jgi:hypothetical protein